MTLRRLCTIVALGAVLLSSGCCHRRCCWRRCHRSCQPASYCEPTCCGHAGSDVGMPPLADGVPIAPIPQDGHVAPFMPGTPMPGTPMPSTPMPTTAEPLHAPRPMPGANNK